MAFGTLPGHVRHQRFAPGAFPRRLRAWRERNNLSQSEAALKLQISKRTLQEWEQGRAAPRGFARTAIEKQLAPSAPRGVCWAEVVAIRESRIASGALVPVRCPPMSLPCLPRRSRAKAAGLRLPRR